MLELDKKALINVSAVVVTAIISSIILYKTVIVDSLLGELGLIGLFFSSLFSHLTVVGRGIFGPTLLLLTSVYHPVVLGCFAGWGGAIGEVSTYYLGSAIRETVEEEKENGLKEWINRYGLIIILLLAATPLPDTPIILLASSRRFPISKILLIEGIGKTIFYSFGAVFGGLLFRNLTDIVGNLVSSVIIVVASLAFCIIVSWEKTRNKLFEIGNRLKNFLGRTRHA